MTTLYLAGPMRGIPEFNFPAFFEAEARLVSAGFNVINPARRDVDNGFDYRGKTGNEDLSEVRFDLREALLWDLEAVSGSDGVALLHGYSKSSGAQAEIALAKALGIPFKVVAQWLGSPGVLGGSQPERLYAPGDFDQPPALVDELSIAGQLIHPETMHGGAVMTTSATGGQKGRKTAELAAIDPLALLTLAEVAGFGARKYDTFNYLKGYDWSLNANAALRHLLGFLNGEDFDPETGLPHPAHFAWHGLALTSSLLRGIGTDDRVTSVVGR